MQLSFLRLMWVLLQMELSNKSLTCKRALIFKEKNVIFYLSIISFYFQKHAIIPTNKTHASFKKINA